MDAVAAEKVKIRARFERALKAYEREIKRLAETGAGEVFKAREACYRAHDKLRCVLETVAECEAEIERMEALRPGAVAAADAAFELRAARRAREIKELRAAAGAV